MHFNGDILDEPGLLHFAGLLEKRLMMPVPGHSSHIKMASRIRLDEYKFEYDRAKAIPSSVLILFYPVKNRIFTVFILRPKYNGVHSGQISFPGGKKEETDRTLVETALRESKEEINVEPSHVRVLGTLTELYIPPSNFLVLPVIGYTETRPDFIADPVEVDKIIETDLEVLFDKKLKKEKMIEVHGHQINAPYYDLQGHVLWGATAMILTELLEVIESMN